MSGSEPSRLPYVVQRRVLRLIQQLARRMQAHRLSGDGIRGTSEASWRDDPAGGPVRREAPIAGRIRSSGQRALLRQLLVGGGERPGSRAQGRR